MKGRTEREDPYEREIKKEVEVGKVELYSYYIDHLYLTKMKKGVWANEDLRTFIMRQKCF